MKNKGCKVCIILFALHISLATVLTGTSTTERRSEIFNEAERQMIRLPEINSKVKLYSTFAQGYLNVRQLMNERDERQLKVKNSASNLNSVFWRSGVFDTGNFALISFITDQAVSYYEGDSQQPPTGSLERLMRSGSSLVAKVCSEGSAAHFMVKRFPPICGNTTDYSTVKPHYVQLMLIEPNSTYHRTLLDLDYNHRGQLLVKLTRPTENDCPPPHLNTTASTLPGSLFMLSYGGRH